LIDLQKKSKKDKNLKYVEMKKFDNDSIYTGYVRAKDEQREGPGMIVWPDNTRYEGEWRNDKAEGRGKLFHSDGDVYTGEWKQDKTDGHGEYVHADGTRYEGQWKDDLQHGQGKETW